MLAHSSALDVVTASKPPSASEAAPKEHYWGQALQYLERAVEARACRRRGAFAALKRRRAMQVQAGQKVTLLYAVQQDKLHFRHGRRDCCGALCAD